MSGDQLILQLAPQLGLSFVFLVIAYFLWQYLQKKEQHYREDLKEKSVQIEKQNEMLMAAFKENTAMTERVNSTVQNNTNAIKDLKTITEKIWENIK